MIKRILEISSEPLHVAVLQDQLVLRPRQRDAEPRATVPCEDVGLLIIDHPAVTFTHQALTRLVQAGAAVVLCGPDHLPCGVLLPVSTNTEVVSRLRTQIDASRPVNKRLWKQIVRAKIRNQADNLPAEHPARLRLREMIPQVRSGDPQNFEAQAARFYWQAWRADPEFRRDPDAPDPINGLLNYGYAIVRAAVARALVSAGLHPALGLQHSHRSNPFCLADDLMEPMRPWVDRIVARLALAGDPVINPESKRALLGLLHQPVRCGNAAGPLMVALHRTCASLVRCLAGEEKKLLLPRLLTDPPP
jgi:CRISPR-associated protein Cas1